MGSRVSLWINGQTKRANYWLIKEDIPRFWELIGMMSTFTYVYPEHSFASPKSLPSAGDTDSGFYYRSTLIGAYR